jgi:LmbE family N-acetylglucosaminyl deacetylase
MRKAIIIVMVLISLLGVDRQYMKSILRRLAIGLNRLGLRCFSRRYVPCDGPSIVFAPHQDDETLGCGAMIARKRNEGLPVEVVFITDGSASHPGHPRFSSTAMREMRQKEARKALAILGVESHAIHFLNAPDGMLPRLSPVKRAEIISEITGLLTAIRPREIFLPCSPDGSSEHEAAFVLIHEAVRTAGQVIDVWQYPVWSWWNPLLLIKHMLFAGACCRQPAEDFKEMKIQALACYQSQISPLPPQTRPSLPPELVHIFESDEEFFFRFDLLQRQVSRQPGSHRAAI